MTNHAVLDNVTHKDLRVITERSARYGDNIACSTVFPIELRQVQAQYPIVLRKNADSGRFEPIALFGLNSQENLFLDEGGWDASYIPLSVERQPFLIGVNPNPGAESELSVHIDMDSPRVSQTEGEPVFLQYGGDSPFLQRITSVLLAIHEGHEQNRGLTDALAGLELLEPFTLDIQLQDGSKHKLAGLYTINEDRLRSLDGEAVADLHRAGYLEAVYMILASLPNFKRLIERKNARL